MIRSLALPLAALLALQPLPAADSDPAPAPRTSLAPGPTAWLPNGGQPGARYGRSVATAGDVNGDGFSDVLVGAPGYDDGQVDEGRAFLYLGSPTGPSATPAWSFSDDFAGGRLGEAVGPAGDINNDGYDDVLVGQPGWNDGVSAERGRAYLFLGGANGLPATPSKQYNGFSGSPGAHFGASLGPAGDMNNDGFADMVFGAPGHSSGEAGEGEILVYAGTDNVPFSGLLFVSDSNLPGAALGTSVATAGDVNGDGFADLVAGAPYASGGGTTAAGKMFVYLGRAVPVLYGPADTVFTGGADSTRLGTSVAGMGDANGDGYSEVVIGIPGHGGGFGYAPVFAGSSGGLRQQVEGIDWSSAGEELGTVVGPAGDVNGDGYADVLVSVPGAPGTPQDGGRVIVLRGRRGGGLVPQPDVLTVAGSVDFGASAAAAGDVNGDGFGDVLVGDPRASVIPGAEEGRAFLWLGGPSPPVLAPDQPFVGTQDPGQFGGAVAFLPQVDIEEFGALVVGEPLWDDPGKSDAGRILIHRGGWGTVASSAAFTRVGAAALERIGANVVDAGDVNRDTFSDLLVSSPTASPGGIASAGEAQLVLGGSPFTWNTLPAANGVQPTERLGNAIAGRGDVDGDGHHDLLVASRAWNSATLTDCGRVQLFYGAAGGLEPSVWTAEGTIAEQGLGASVAFLGDIDGDGYSDFAIGSSTAGGSPIPGRVDVYYGDPAGPSATPAWSLSASPPSPSFGSVIARVGDVTGDGVSDFAVGDPLAGIGGRVTVYAGQRSRGRPAQPILSLAGTQANSRFGAAIAGGGDVDGDGFGDFAVGVPQYAEGQANEGQVRLYRGAPFVPQAAAVWTHESDVADAVLGSSLAAFNDINSDGFADLAVGAPGGVGRAYVFFGGGGGVPREFRVTEACCAGVPRLRPARSDHQTQIGVTQWSRAPVGRGRFRTQSEIRLLGEPFTGVPGPSSFLFQDSGAPTPAYGSVLSVGETIAAPWPGSTYHLRGRVRTQSPHYPWTRWVTPEAHLTGEHDVWTPGAVVDAGGPPARGAATPRITSLAPNPAGRGTVTRIGFTLPRAARARLDVFDARGTRVRRIAAAALPAGPASLGWDGRDAHGRPTPAGLYFVTLTVDGMVDRARVVRLP